LEIDQNAMLIASNIICKNKFKDYT